MFLDQNKKGRRGEELRGEELEEQSRVFLVPFRLIGLGLWRSGSKAQGGGALFSAY